MSCPRGTSKIVISARNPNADMMLSGQERLSQRLDYVNGMRVLDFRVTSYPIEGESFIVTGGEYFKLKSAKLAQILAKNPFNIGTAVDDHNIVSNFESDVIAIGFTEGDQSDKFEAFNQYMPFYTNCSLEYFDWSLEIVNGTFDTNFVAYCIEIVIEFTHACFCNK